MPKFKIGDIVRYNNGTYDMEVLSVKGKASLCKYLHSGGYSWIKDYNLKLITTNQPEGDDEMAKRNTLYEVTTDDKVTFATYLATNSDGKYVMEEKGTGTVFVAENGSISEVIPYSISVQFVNSGETVYQYQADKKADISKNDLLVVKSNGSMAFVVVTAVDTKSKNATKQIEVIGKVSIDKS